MHVGTVSFKLATKRRIDIMQLAFCSLCERTVETASPKTPPTLDSVSVVLSVEHDADGLWLAKVETLPQQI